MAWVGVGSSSGALSPRYPDRPSRTHHAQTALMSSAAPRPSRRPRRVPPCVTEATDGGLAVTARDSPVLIEDLPLAGLVVVLGPHRLGIFLSRSSVPAPPFRYRSRSHRF